MNRYLLLFIVIGLVGCATEYQATGMTGGYSETRLGENIYRVSFQGNGFTNVERVTDFTLLRSAELTIRNGYKWFAIIDSAQAVNKSTATIGSNRSNTVGSVNPSTGTFNATTFNSSPTTYVVSKPSASNTIVMYKAAEKPEGISYNAFYIRDSITIKYNIYD